MSTVLCRMLKTRALAPIPKARVVATTELNAGLRRQIESFGGFAGMAQKLFREMFVDGGDRSARDAIIARAVAMDDPNGRALIESMVTWDCEKIEAVLDTTTMPVLAIQSTYLDTSRTRVALEPGGTTPYTELVLARCPDARVDIISDVGHFNMLDAPDVFNTVLARFLARVATSG